MKNLKSYIFGLTASIALGGTLTACQDDFDMQPIDAPVATLTPNMTILELKTKYWNDAWQYIDTIGIENGVDDGQPYVIRGWVASSDEAGNVFKNLVIQDGTAAIALSINSYNLYLNYRVGQEVVLDLKGMYIGKYRGLLQLGTPDYDENRRCWTASFMAPEFFQIHAQRNGFPDVSKVDTLVVNNISEINTDNPSELIKNQSRLVRINNVYFENGGKEKFSTYHSSGVNQTIKDTAGSTLNVRTSGYSNFWNNLLPEGNFDIVGILSYYKSSETSTDSPWQLVLIDYDGCMNIGNPTVPVGAEDNPYTVADAIASVNNGTDAAGWVKGYIVGAVAPMVTEVKSNSDIEWSADVALSNTLVIGATKDTKDIADAMIVELPVGSDFRTFGNLNEHPENYQREIYVKGKFGKYMGTYGILENTGTKAEFKIEGVEIGGGEVAPDGDGTEAKPYNVGQVIAMNPQGNKDNPDVKGAWVTGYIVGWADMSTVYYINAETAKFTAPATANTNMLIAATPDVTDYSKCLGIQLPSGTVRDALNLQSNPGNLGKKVTLLGDICKYSGVPGMRNASKFVLGDGSGDTPDVPTPGSALFEESFSNGQGQFIINNVVLPSALTYVWNADTDYGYMKASAYKGQSYASEAWLISPVFDLAAASDVTLTFDHAINKHTSVEVAKTQSTVWVSVDGADWQQLTGVTYPTTLSWTFINAGNIDLSAYSGKKIQIGFRYTSEDNASGTWEIKNFALNGIGSVTTSAAQIPGGGSGTVTPPDDPDDPKPDTPITANSADFNTFNGGSPNTMSYGEYSTTQGWTTKWALILAGGTEATNFISTDATFLFPCIDGTPARPGKLTSPTITGGLGTLKFNYGFPYNETKVGFTVNILQGGNVVATDKVLADPATKATVFEYSHAFNISGDFVIEIVNDLVTNSSSNNKDRLAIWNLTW